MYEYIPLIVIGVIVVYAFTQKKNDPKVEPKVEPKVAPKVEPKVKSKVKSKVTPNEPKVEPVDISSANIKVEPKVEPKQKLTPPSGWKPGMDPHTGEAFTEYDPSVVVEGSGAPHIGGGLTIAEATKIAVSQLNLMRSSGAGEHTSQDLIDLGVFLTGPAADGGSITLSNGHTVSKSADDFGNTVTEWKHDGKAVPQETAQERWRREIAERLAKE